MYTVYSLIHSPLILDLALIQCIYTLSFIYSPKPSAGPLTSHLSSATSPLIHLKHPMHAHGTPHSPKHPIHAHFSHSSILRGFLSSLSSLPSFLLSCHLCRSAQISPLLPSLLPLSRLVSGLLLMVVMLIRVLCSYGQVLSCHCILALLRGVVGIGAIVHSGW